LKKLVTRGSITYWTFTVDFYNFLSIGSFDLKLLAVGAFPDKFKGATGANTEADVPTTACVPASDSFAG
jgi:hypothetical protein